MEVCDKLAEVYEKLGMKEECQKIRKFNEAVEHIYGDDMYRTYGQCV